MGANKVVQAMGKKFGFTIKNSGATAIVIALLAGIIDTAKVTAAGTPLAYTISQNNAKHLQDAGYPDIDAVLDDGTVMTGVVCNASNKIFSIRQFREYVKHQGLVLKGMSISASNSDVFGGTINVTYHTPLTGPKTNYINLDEFNSVNQNSETKILLENLNMPLDVETIMTMPIPADRTVSFWMQFE